MISSYLSGQRKCLLQSFTSLLIEVLKYLNKRETPFYNKLGIQQTYMLALVNGRMPRTLTYSNVHNFFLKKGNFKPYSRSYSRFWSTKSKERQERHRNRKGRTQPHFQIMWASIWKTLRIVPENSELIIIFSKGSGCNINTKINKLSIEE